MRNMFIIFIGCALLSGCAASQIEMTRDVIGNSIKDVEDSRKDAVSKEFDHDRMDCYAKIEKLLEKMPHTSIYFEDEDVIAVFYMNPNTTPVGVFFTDIGKGRTKVEVSSPATGARDWVAKNVFSDKVMPPEKFGKFGSNEPKPGDEDSAKKVAE